jgi:RNA polymerase sigma-70 factor (ECF subfamily)
MNARDADARWERLIALLRPIHGQAMATARRLCRSAADGDDLYQDSVLRAFEKLHTLRDESRFRAWFYATLLSRHRSRSRRSFWRRFLPWERAFGEGDGPAGDRGEERAERTWQAARAARALAGLPAPQREAVVLFEIDGYSIEEIAGMQHVSVSAVKSRLARGRERLRRHYERLESRERPAPGRAIPTVPVRGSGESNGSGSLAGLAIAPERVARERAHD